MDFENLSNVLENKFMVPILFLGKYSESTVLSLADGSSIVSGANNLREGIVIGLREERYNDEIGRIKLKLVSNQFLMKDNASN